MPKWIERLAAMLAALPRSNKRALMLVGDTLFVPAALWCAISLRLGSVDHQTNRSIWLYLTALVVAVPVFTKLGLYRAVIRFMGGPALVAVTAGVTASVILLLIITQTVMRGSVPISSII